MKAKAKRRLAHLSLVVLPSAPTDKSHPIIIGLVLFLEERSNESGTQFR